MEEVRHCSVQVRGLLTRDELDRYNALMDVGHFLEAEKRRDLAYTIQREIDILILPAIDRLKAKSRERDRMTEQYLQSKDSPSILESAEATHEDES